MKKIENILKKKKQMLLEFLELADKQIYKAINNKVYFAGGCIPSLLENTYVSDYDIFFNTKKDLDKFVETVKDPIHHAALFDAAYDHNIKLIESDNAITLAFSNKEGKQTDAFQIIIKNHIDLNSLNINFDFDHLCGFFYFDQDILHVPDKIYRLVHTKELVYTRSKYPISTLLRVRKYIKKGWTIDINNMLKILLDCHVELLKGNKIIKQDRETIVEYIESYFNHDDDMYDNEKSEDYYCDMENEFYEKFTQIAEDVKINIPNLKEQISGIDPLLIDETLSKFTTDNVSIYDLINNL